MKIYLAALALFLAACASYDGRSLVPGQSTAAQVEALMGRPAERLTNAAGETVWFYPTAPNGRDTYAVRMRPDGTVIGVEQVLTQANLARVVAGKTTAKEVRELLGPPSSTTRWWLRDVDEWDYLVLADNRFHDFLIEFSAGGVVSKTALLHDAVYDAGGTLP